MVLPILAGLALVTSIGVARAAWRARQRLLKMPPSAFGIVDIRHKDAGANNFLYGGFSSGPMTYNEAMQILGLPLSPIPSKKQLNAQHRRVMLANHPDHGGSSFMAQKINEAKTVVAKHVR